jgi:hypothetical protein
MNNLKGNVEGVQKAMQAAEAAYAAAGGQGPQPRLGVAEAAIAALGGVKQLEAKMLAMEFRCG